MRGNIAGDIVGSPFERRPIKTTAFDLEAHAAAMRVTDDTVLTLATAHALVAGISFAQAYAEFGAAHPNAGYGGSFHRWLHQHPKRPYGSWGNGSAMRVSPVGWWFATADEVLEAAAESARVTHDHPEGIRGAQAVALATLYAREGRSRDDIRDLLTARFGYELATPLDELRPASRFDVSCQGSVPPAIRAFLESRDTEHAIRLAVSLGGDSDTQACIAGGLAYAASRQLSPELETLIATHLPPDLTTVLTTFEAAVPHARPDRPPAPAPHVPHATTPRRGDGGPRGRAR